MKLKFWQNLLLVLVAATAAFFGAGGTSAQEEATDAAKKYDIRFPIAELGGCKDISSCRSFCEDPVNYTTCINYAKSKGFYKEDFALKKDEILEKAKQTLGCDSFESCKSYCDKPEHADECDKFAKKNNLSGGQVKSVEEKKILEKAKEVLGCTSPQDCMTFCGLESNKKKCTDFAKETGLHGGEEHIGPGGCTSEGTCRDFCSDPTNYLICSSYSKSVGEGSFSGPGGCNSMQSCEAYCRQNPEKCRSVTEFREGGSNYSPQEFCARTPNCLWSNNTCTCGSYGGGNYNSACPQNYYFGPGGICTPLDKSQDAWRCSQAGRYWDGSSCRDSSPEGTTGNYNPQDMCNRTTNCSWANNSCSCAFNGEIKTYTPGSQEGYYGSKESQEATCKSGGGTCDWSSGICNCKGYQSPISGGTPGTSPYPGTSSYPSSSGYYGSRESQESTCKSGGGTCDWSPGYCRCTGYNSSGTTTGGNYATPYPYSSSGYSSDPATACGQAGGSWNGSYCQMPTSTSTSTSTTTSTMSRDQQQAGCTSCGGTCNWNGDTCQCQCGSSSSTSSTAPAPTSAPSTQSNPAPQQSTPAPSVQGVSVSINSSIFQMIRDLIFGR